MVGGYFTVFAKNFIVLQLSYQEKLILKSTKSFEARPIISSYYWHSAKNVIFLWIFLVIDIEHKSYDEECRQVE